MGYSHTGSVRFHGRMGADPAYRQIVLHQKRLVRREHACQHRISGLFPLRYFSVHRKVFRIFRNPQAQGDFSAVGVHCDPSVFLGQSQRPGDTVAVDIQIHFRRIRCHGVDIGGQGREQFQQHGRTAGTSVPVPSGNRAVTDQRVLVEILLPVFPHGGQHIVVQRPLKAVEIHSVRPQQCHFPAPEGQSHPGAGFQIGVVGQIVVHVKAFDVVPGTDAAADVHLPQGHAVPQGIQCLPIACIQLLLYSRRTGIAQSRPDGMTHGFPLFGKGQVILIIRRRKTLVPGQGASLVVATVVVPETGHIQILFRPDVVLFHQQNKVPVLFARIPEQPVQLYHRFFRQGMAGDPVGFGRIADIPADQTGRTDGNFQKGSLSGSTVVVDPGFDQSALVVQVMLDDDVPTVFTPASVRIAALGLGTEESVLVLGGGNLFDIPIQSGFDGRIGIHGQKIADPPDGFKKQSVREGRAFVFLYACSGKAEIFQIPGFFQFVQYIGYHTGTDFFQIRLPEGICQSHLCNTGS